MSASAPLGSPSMNTGSVDAVWTSATMTVDVVSVVISQAAATSFIHMQVFAIIHTIHSLRKTGSNSGAQGEDDVLAEAGSGVVGSGTGDDGLGRTRATGRQHTTNHPV